MIRPNQQNNLILAISPPGIKFWFKIRQNHTPPGITSCPNNASPSDQAADQIGPHTQMGVLSLKNKKGVVGRLG